MGRFLPVCDRTFLTVLDDEKTVITHRFVTVFTDAFEKNRFLLSTGHQKPNPETQTVALGKGAFYWRLLGAVITFKARLWLYCDVVSIPEVMNMMNHSHNTLEVEVEKHGISIPEGIYACPMHAHHIWP